MLLSVFFETFYENIFQTSLIEFVAVLFGLVSVWYCRKENILVYPTGLVNVGLYVYICYNTGLLGNMGINLVYFVMSVYGWWKWTRKDSNQDVLHVTRLKLWSVGAHILAMVFLYAVVYQILVVLSEGTNLVLDAVTTSIFVIAMWLQARKKLESWILWIIGDVIAIPLYYSSGLFFTGFQYFVFLLLALSGLFEWIKSYRKNSLSIV